MIIKPNIVYLKSQTGYRTGDVTDQRVTRAVIEYVGEKSKASRITLAEGGSYRSLKAVSVDAVAASLMGFAPEQVPYLAMAEKSGAYARISHGNSISP